jgi:hypothetical protein
MDILNAVPDHDRSVIEPREPRVYFIERVLVTILSLLRSIKILLRDLGNDLQVLLVSCNVNVEDAEAARKLVSRDAMFRSRILADCLA